ncbi:hypothetical protein M8A51_01195 [Schlegelella sp. S2-27]|uniref:Porin n=1 Tax=Caldimonas mangrovi TaxID=2944811 RepID=A0ABT0YHD0_9BURK|nr:hypothetical protein [Caldimonas mangrovi]MCM5678146.1 hypothetical protein [Caldimonas mangrovi]
MTTRFCPGVQPASRFFPLPLKLPQLVGAALSLAAPLSLAQPAATNPSPVSPIQLGLVLDGAYSSRELALGSRDKGFALGHTELTAGASIDDVFTGRATLAVHTHDSETELELEEAFVETTRLPAGLQVRGGRFLSQVGYLNELHSHGDDFVERPLLYRAFLGSHWFDTGLRVNWTAPTELYWRTGFEILAGKQLVSEPERDLRVGAWTLSTKVGGDLGSSHSWQVGLAYLRNRLEPHHEEEEDEDEHAHEHAHGARYTGGKMVIADGVWKWAPDGNNRERQLRLSAEYARVTDINEHAGAGDVHRAWYVSAVYRFLPQWEAGVRFDDLKVREPHDDHFHAGHLQETALSLAWKRSHFSTLRVQWTRQRDRGDFDDAANSLQLQYVMSLGAHGAHSF